MLMFVLYVIIAFITFKLYLKYTCGICTCQTMVPDKVVIITGANSGIGFETAIDLARRGAKVILACRDVSKGSAARDRIIESTGNRKIIFRQLNLASLQSVHDFADDILRTEPKVHVLINNAGTGKLDNSLTEDNLPIEPQVNHFAPFLLTVKLLPVLKASAPSRIINVSSVMHWFGNIDPKKFDKPAESYFEHMRVYSNTKLANILFANKLSSDLKESRVTANSLHPGAVATNIFRDKNFIVKFLLKLMFKTPWQGAQTSIHLAVSPDLTNATAKYFSDCEETKMSKAACDRKLAEELWDLSERAVIRVWHDAQD